MAVLTCQESALIFFSSCHHRKNILLVLGKIEKRKGFHNLYIHIQNTLCYQKRCVKNKILIWETRPTPISAVYCTECLLVLYILIFFNTAFPYYQDYVCRHTYTYNKHDLALMAHWKLWKYVHHPSLSVFFYLLDAI